jgi:hypothetical protein
MTIYNRSIFSETWITPRSSGISASFTIPEIISATEISN